MRLSQLLLYMWVVHLAYLASPRYVDACASANACDGVFVRCRLCSLVRCVCVVFVVVFVFASLFVLALGFVFVLVCVCADVSLCLAIAPFAAARLQKIILAKWSQRACYRHQGETKSTNVLK